MFPKDGDLLRWVSTQLSNLPHIQAGLKSAAERLDKLDAEEKAKAEESKASSESSKPVQVKA